MNPTAAEGPMAAPFSPEQSLPPVPRPHAVSEVTPAKRITFFKSGDPQFGGVKMAISRRSFKSFSTLMDDLSNRVPLPFGVRTITTPRGTHSVNRLEQLQDGGSYICSDKKYVQPIDLSGSGRKTGVHRPHRPISARRHAQQEDVEEDYRAAHIPQAPKLRKKITLVKNGDPSVRRSIVLNRRNARSFKTFIEDASDLLQYTVRRLYTVDGRRIENMQGVLQLPTILICVGREPFKPIQIDNARKGASEKLPGLRSHPSITSEAADNKKNANFGLKTKKSVIHPRSASSNKTRFSLSSDKSYPNGLNMSPVNNCFAAFADNKPDSAAHSLVNDDIEKKVHVNKDGSLSVEMKVRFRLLNEETLQWSTQIKKSSTVGKAKSEQICLYDEDEIGTQKQMNPENFSETDDSFYPCDADSYSSKLNDAEIEDMYCSHCGMQCQEYDIWKNPMHINPPDDYAKQSTWQRQSSASSTSSHRRLTSNQKTSVDSPHTMSSEEYTERIVHKSSSYSETRENGETTVRYSAVSQCTCRSTQSVISNPDVASETGCREYRNKSCSGPKSLCSTPNRCSGKFRGSKHLRSGSSEDRAETSPTPRSNSECQRVSVMSESSSRKCHRWMSTRSSTNPRSPKSNISCDEDEEKGRGDVSTPTRNISRASKADSDFEDMGGGERAEIPAVHEKTNSEFMGNTENNEVASNSSRTPGIDCEESSTRASSRTSQHSEGGRAPRINSGQKNRRRSCNSSCSSSISMQNGETLLADASSCGPRDKEVYLETCSALTNLNMNSYAENRQHTLQSNHSLQSSSSVAESIPRLKQDDQPSSNSPGNCEEPPKSHPASKSETGMASPAHSRTSGKSQSISLKYNCVSGPENDNLSSTSSRVSSACEKESKRSSGICDHESTHSSVKETKRTEEPNNDDQGAKTPSKASDSEFECAYSPSPPKGHPAKRNLRLSKFKHSSGSVSSDQVKAFEKMEKMGSSRSSTPGSKGVFASKDSMETCKKIKNATNSGAEEATSVKRRKSSTSSSKKKVHNDDKIHNELIPAALPNVSSEEVVHEWLRKIPSGTSVVDYEVEECPKKACKDTRSEMTETITTKGTEESQMSKDCIAGTQISNPKPNEGTCGNEVDNTLDTVKKEGTDEHTPSDKVQTNTECREASVELHCHKRALPTTINTSVQIMKALLSPSQDPKFDRSNSLPEVSPVMGRRLSNSAKVLISCLASLQLLDDGQTDPSDKSKEFNKSKYGELLNIFQALWADGPAKKCVKNVKSGKNYSREDEVTPVSSSGVDVNSGYGGSGDGSIIGGDCPVTAVKAAESVLTTTAMDTKITNNMTTCNDSCGTPSGDAENKEGVPERSPTTDLKKSFCLGDADSLDVDENMNEKKIDSQDNNGIDGEPPSDVVINGDLDDNFTNVIDELIGNPEQKTCNDDNLNNLNNAENNPQLIASDSPEANCISSPSDTQSTFISSHDSSGKNEASVDRQSYNNADPVWVLKLLKKIEKEFMTHYVDAMNEFKVRWNLEHNENLDEMIAELKNEVSGRIQRSIADELKKIKSRAGQKTPRPPDEGSRRKSSLQAEERRKHLQTMRKRSILLLANGENNRQNWTNDVSCETDEEDLTFSASFGDELNGQPNDEEFCPCETCIKKKKAFKLSKPVAADAPIMRAFDLREILKMKKVAHDGTINSKVDECNKEMDEPVTEQGGTDMCGEEGSPCTSRLGDKMTEVKSECSAEEQEDRASVGNENEDCSANDVQGQEEEFQDNIVTTEEEKQDEGLEAVQDANVDEKEGYPQENDTTGICEESQRGDQETGSSKLDDGHTVDQVLESTTEDEEEKDSENGEDPARLSIDDEVPEENNGSISEENETEINKDGNVSEDDDGEGSEGSQRCRLPESILGQHSLIKQNGSADDGDAERKDANGSTGESSPNGQSNSSGSKQAQMYPDSSSEDEAGDSTCASPVCNNKNEATCRVYVNNKGSFEGSENISKKDSQEEVIDQDDFDF